MHLAQIIRTNMGRYKAVCACGWQSKTVSKTKAIDAQSKHLQKAEDGKGSES